MQVTSFVRLQTTPMTRQYSYTVLHKNNHFCYLPGRPFNLAIFRILSLADLAKNCNRTVV